MNCFEETWSIHLYFLSFLDIESRQVVEIFTMEKKDQFILWIQSIFTMAADHLATQGNTKVTFLTPGNTFAHLVKNPMTTFWYLSGKCPLWVIKLMVHTSYIGEHFLLDLDIFQLDFMFVKPCDVPPMFCFNMQTDMKFIAAATVSKG